MFHKSGGISSQNSRVPSSSGSMVGGKGGSHGKQSPKTTPREHETPRVTPEEYRRLRELLESKCDEVDDLSNNLKLAKESLRHLSQRLDAQNEELEKNREENSVLQKENMELRRSLSSVKSMADEKLEMAARLEQGLLKFQADLESKEANLLNEKKRLERQLEENAVELQRREQRIHRLMTGLEGMEEGIAVGRVHVKKLSQLLSSRCPS